MVSEKIRVRITEFGQRIEVVLFSRHASSIPMLIGAGEHSMKCTLNPTRNEMAHAGSIIGR